MSLKNQAMQESKNELLYFKTLVKWIIFASVTGIVVGLVGTGVVIGINFATSIRQAHKFVTYFLPVGGLLAVFIYKINKREKDSGTNAVLGAIRNQNTIQLRTTPLIIIATLITHLVGGSAGREGAALQFGGSLGEGLGKLFKFNDKDRTLIIMCGMSAAFSAVFGVPIAAVLFPMEVVSIGIMYYSALVPCTISALVAHEVALFCGIESEMYPSPVIDRSTPFSVFIIVIIAILCGILSIIFCQALHSSHEFFEKKLPNPYIRVVVGGTILILLTLIFGTDYNGVGSDVIKRAVEEGYALPWAFIVKLIFTVITLSVGYKGGEIVPSFFIGATLGATLGSIVGLSPSLCAAIGMICVFCGVTNCPITSFIIACELFSFERSLYFLIAVGITYLISGYKSLYKAQKIMYSKTEPKYINKETE